MEKKNRQNELALWRKFDRTDKQPVAKGNAIVGAGDFKLQGSMWPSKSGTSQDGKKWQVWNVTLQPAQGETRKLVAVPADMLDSVLALINGGSVSSAPPPASPDMVTAGTQEYDDSDIPF